MPSARERAERERRGRLLEIGCVLVVVGAVVALVVWIVSHAGGGALNLGAMSF